MTTINQFGTQNDFINIKEQLQTFWPFDRYRNPLTRQNF